MNSFCDKERTNIRRENENDEDFDILKSLAKAWRDLGPNGQKPYFAEYDKNQKLYKEECLGLGVGTVGNKRKARATSVGSSVAPTPYEAEGASPPVSTNEEGEEGAGAGFTAVNR